MAESESWATMRERRLAEPAAAEAYEAARLVFELGRSVRELRERRGWSQSRLAKESGMTQPAVARFEAGGTVPTLVVLERLAGALAVSLKVGFVPREEAAQDDVLDLSPNGTRPRQREGAPPWSAPSRLC
jgi:transcriptional regulator with XRE-family HTH domain